MDVIAIALSGLNAQQQRLAASANNIANATTAGAVPEKADKSGTQPPVAASTVYKPLSVSLTALTAGDLPGGVKASVIENKDAYSVRYDPTSADANADGLTAVPNVDFATESINIMESKVAFKANLSVIKVEKDMQKELLDIIT